MKLKVKHSLFYKGKLYKTGADISVDDENADEMKQYGEIIEESTAFSVNTDDFKTGADISVDGNKNNNKTAKSITVKKAGKPKKK